MKISMIALGTMIVMAASSTSWAQDCEARRSFYPDTIELRIDHLESGSWTKVNIPTEFIPLPEGLDVKLQPNFSKEDEATLTYRGGVLAYSANLRTNLSKDKLELDVYPSLDRIRRASFERTGSGISRWFTEVEAFECQSVKIVR